MKRLPAQHVMVVAVLAYGLGAIVFGEVLSVNNGFGWDGMIYAAAAKDFPGQVLGGKLDRYHLQRVLPSGVVHYGLRLLGLSPADDLHILRGFHVYNLLLLVVGVYAWNGIAVRLGLGPRGTWLGFAAVYANFAVMKMSFYSPVLTDTTALAAGMLLLFGYLAGRTWLVWLTGLLGAFAWPLVLPMALVMLLLPRPEGRGAGDERGEMGDRGRETGDGGRGPNLGPPPASSVGRAPAASLQSRPLAWRWCLAAALPIGAAAMWRVYGAGQKIDGAGPIWYHAVPVAAGLVVLYLAAAMRGILEYNSLRMLQPLALRLPLSAFRFPWRAVLAAAALLAAAVGVQRLVLVPGSMPGYSLKQFLTTTLVASVAKPGVFLVAHAVYFGPIVLLAVSFWPRVVAGIRRNGPALLVLAAAAAVLGITSESRQLLSFLPLVAAFAVLAREDVRLPWWHDGLFVCVGLLSSKCWLRLSRGPSSGSLLEFPDQYHFMNQGPWMSDGSFLVQGAIVLGLLVLFAMVYRCGRQDGVRRDTIATSGRADDNSRRAA